MFADIGPPHTHLVLYEREFRVSEGPPLCREAGPRAGPVRAAGSR